MSRSRPFGPLGGGSGRLSYLVRRYSSTATGFRPSGTGYCRYCNTHNRPRSSKLIETGCRTSGSLATSRTSIPSATVNFLMASRGGRAFGPCSARTSLSLSSETGAGFDVSAALTVAASSIASNTAEAVFLPLPFRWERAGVRAFLFVLWRIAWQAASGRRSRERVRAGRPREADIQPKPAGSESQPLKNALDERVNKDVTAKPTFPKPTAPPSFCRVSNKTTTEPSAWEAERCKDSIVEASKRSRSAELRRMQNGRYTGGSPFRRSEPASAGRCVPTAPRRLPAPRFPPDKVPAGRGCSPNSRVPA